MVLDSLHFIYFLQWEMAFRFSGFVNTSAIYDKVCQRIQSTVVFKTKLNIQIPSNTASRTRQPFCELPVKDTQRRGKVLFSLLIV